MDIIGYVTTGDVSLSRGEGFAIGAIPVVQYFALRKQALRYVHVFLMYSFCLLRLVPDRLSQPSVLVKIRDRDCTTCRVAYLELLDS